MMIDDQRTKLVQNTKAFGSSISLACMGRSITTLYCSRLGIPWEIREIPSPQTAPNLKVHVGFTSLCPEFLNSNCCVLGDACCRVFFVEVPGDNCKQIQVYKLIKIIKNKISPTFAIDVDDSNDAFQLWRVHGDFKLG
jgi:hypothetical protein